MLILLMILFFATLNNVQARNDEGEPTSPISEPDEDEAKFEYPFLLAVKVGSKYEVACTLTGDNHNIPETYRCLSAIPPGEKMPSRSDTITLGFVTEGDVNVEGSDIRSYENLFSIPVKARPETVSQDLTQIAISENIVPTESNEFQLYVRTYEGGRIVLINENIQMLDDSQCSDIARSTSYSDERCFQANCIVGPNFIGGTVVNNGEAWGIVTAAQNGKKRFWARFVPTNIQHKFRPIDVVPATYPPPSTTT